MNLFCRFCERSQALLHGDLHTGSVMVTHDSTQVIDPEFGFYGPMGFDTGAFLGNLILAYFSQDGHADQVNDRKVCVLNCVSVVLSIFPNAIKFLAIHCLVIYFSFSFVIILNHLFTSSNCCFHLHFLLYLEVSC